MVKMIDNTEYPEEMTGLIDHINKVNSRDKEEVKRIKNAILGANK